MTPIANAPAADRTPPDMEPAAVTIRATDVSTHVELVRRAADGDVRAFERLVESGSDRAFRAARAILGNEADARDAAQDAYMSAWRELPRLREAARFDGWFRQILVNACRAHIRDRRQVREIALDPAIDVRQPGPGVSDRVADSDLLSHAFDRLDADKRSLLVLHYLEHRPLGDIAGTLRIPVGTAKWRLSEARAALARALAAEGEARR
jgi:RNA polymerase sigma-70 factor (ECF subfamily)